MDERTCVFCFREKEDLNSIFLNEYVLCRECWKKLKIHKKSYRIQGTVYHVLYEYDEFLEGLFFQFKEQRDRVLAPVFLEREKERLFFQFKGYKVYGMCSSEEKRLFRGFEPLIEMFKSAGITVASPFYKIKNSKQSSRSKKDREKIKEEIQLKQAYPKKNIYKKICLVDDVVTTGATISRGIELLNPDFVFVIAAHPLWIQEHEKEEILDHFFT